MLTFFTLLREAKREDVAENKETIIKKQNPAFVKEAGFFY